MQKLDQDYLLAIEGCEEISELALFVELVQAGLFPRLKQVLNLKLSSPEAKTYSVLLSEVEMGNASELVGTQLYPPLMSAVREVLG